LIVYHALAGGDAPMNIKLLFFGSLFIVAYFYWKKQQTPVIKDTASNVATSTKTTIETTALSTGAKNTRTFKGKEIEP
jgi:hypothetical protein